MTVYDMIIVGGGLAGASLSLALNTSSLRVAIVDAGSAEQPFQDGRVLGLSSVSQKIYQTLGVWDFLEKKAYPIDTIHVSHQGHFGHVQIRAEEEGVPALGYVIPATALLAGVRQAMQAKSATMDYYYETRVIAIDAQQENACLTVEQKGETKQLTARSVIAADGAHSTLRRLLQISTEEKAYGQHVIVCQIRLSRGHQGVAYERFTPSGPLAVLPMHEDRCTVVWTIASKTVEEYLSMSDTAFITMFQKIFGYRLGRFQSVTKRTAIPLQSIRAKTAVFSHGVLLGNAAHTLHPVAAQGFNLSLRDIATLAEVVYDATEAGKPLDEACWRQYQTWREKDTKRILQFTNGLNTLFTSRKLPMILARECGLFAMDLIDSVKHRLVGLTQGRSVRMPKLACGVKLADHV